MRRRLRRWVILAVAAALLAAAASVAADRFTVKWVADGDTVLLEDGRWIRYIGINAPEVATDDHPGEPLGRTARSRNRILIDSSPVSLQFDRGDRDRYGRTLAYVFNHRGRMINESLVAEGLAFCLWIRPNDRYSDRLLSAQRQAMTARRGLWSRLTTAVGPVTGNRNSRRFHRPGCPMAEKISPNNRQSFPSAEDAFKAGYAPAKECLPPTVLFSK